MNRLHKHWINQDIKHDQLAEITCTGSRSNIFVKVLKCDIKDVCSVGLSPLHPQCFASSAGAVLGAVLDPLQHCSRGRSSREAAGAVFSDTRVSPVKNVGELQSSCWIITIFRSRIPSFEFCSNETNFVASNPRLLSIRTVLSSVYSTENILNPPINKQSNISIEYLIPIRVANQLQCLTVKCSLI